ncbi:MAG: PH domain-containing protein [Cellulomonadaceae bacterium]|nr:PH domain-containing protein [Cellulomonadaceae bacterium]
MASREAAMNAGAARSTVLRARVWNSVAGIIAAAAALTGMAALTTPDAPIGDLLVPLLCMTLPGVYFLFRAPFVRLVASSDGVAYHGWFRHTEQPWSEIAKFELDVLDDRVLVAALVPVAVLNDDSRVRFDALAGYASSARAGSSRMARQVAQLESMRTERGTAGREF